MSLPASPRNYRRGNSIDKPKDFISEFSEIVGPVAVVGVVR